MIKELYTIENVRFFAERRRYGNTTYTWVYIRKSSGEGYLDLGDPWPCITPKKSEVWQQYKMKFDHSPSMTTLDLFCKTFGWQGGTIHQAKRHFAVCSMEQMDHFCSKIIENMHEITDIETASWFTTHRREASGLVIRAMQAGH